MILAFVYFLGIWGFVAGLLLFLFFVATNTTLSAKHHYLYPLIPFNARDFFRLIVRRRKNDFDKKEEKSRQNVK